MLSSPYEPQKRMSGALAAVIVVAAFLWVTAVLCAIMFAIMRRWRLLAISGASIFGLTAITFAAALLAPSEKQPAIARAAPTPRPARTDLPFPKYLELRAGQCAVLDSNHEGDGSMGTLFDNLATVRKWASAQFNGPEDLPHHDFPVGTHVVVRSWTHVNAAGGDDYLMIKVITTTTPQREGYVRDISLLPLIPSGARLVVYSSIRTSPSATMELRRDGTQHSPTLTIPNGTPISLLAVAPNGESISPYRARVLSGPHRGARGWFDVFSLGAPSPPVRWGQYSNECRCVSLYLAEVNPSVKQPRPTEASVSAEPAPAEASATTQDYMNEACILMYDGAQYAFDFGEGGEDGNNMRIVSCKLPGGDLVYFRKQHLAESKSQYANDNSPPGTPGGYRVPPLGTSGATPFPETSGN